MEKITKITKLIEKGTPVLLWGNVDDKLLDIFIGSSNKVIFDLRNSSPQDISSLSIDAISLSSFKSVIITSDLSQVPIYVLSRCAVFKID